MKSELKKTMQSAGKWVSDNKKPILIIVAVIVSIALTIWIGKKIYAWVVGKINEAKIVNDSEDHTGTSVTSTLQFKSLVVRLIEATRLWGTNENEIYNVLGELRTQADWEALKRTWVISYQNANKVAQLSFYIGGCQSTLIGTLYSELDESELQHCREILQSHGITPDF